MERAGGRFLTVIDHALAIGLALMCLSQLFLDFDPSNIKRSQLYAAGAASGAVFGAVPLLLWVAAGRPMDSFGLFGWRAPDGLTVAIALLWAAGLAAAVAAIKRGRFRAGVEPVYHHFAYLMPRSRRELGQSWAVSLSAGVGEEIAFRGFLLWYGAALLGTVPGLAATCLLFGAAHSYQKRMGLVFSTLAGLVLGAAFLAGGSLMLVIWMHATWNMASFTAGRFVLASTGEGSEAQL